MYHISLFIIICPLPEVQKGPFTVVYISYIHLYFGCLLTEFQNSKGRPDPDSIICKQDISSKVTREDKYSNDLTNVQREENTNKNI